ncbi:caspase family protein [Ferruginibacter sp.]|uniref:caspase family protein n=1 Tax=Ferruginibacter sp. TaxID=1940288 RepID=UPI0019B06A65|nr:caspase family protein [Ferruginibacter sp.]MBC7629543.1 caspase family protein [Ferruginibacter sp.]
MMPLKNITIVTVLLITLSIAVIAQQPKLMLPIGHTKSILITKFSPNGKYVLTASADADLKLWDLVTGKLLHTYAAHKKAISFIAFNNDGSLIASASEDSTAIIWETVSGKMRYQLKGHTESVTRVEFNNATPEVMTSSLDRTIKTWDLNNGALLADVKVKPIREGFYSKNGEKIIYNLKDDEVAICYQEQEEYSCYGLRKHTDLITAVELLDDLSGLITASRDSTIILWSLKGEIIKRIKFNYAIGGMQLSADGKKILLISMYNPYIEMRNLSDTSLIGSFGSKENKYSVSNANWIKAKLTPKGNYLFVALDNNDSSYLLAVSDKLNMVNTFTTRHGIISDINFSNDGTQFILSDQNNNATVWHVGKKDPTIFLKGYTHYVNHAQSIFNDSLTLVASRFGPVELWDNRQDNLLYAIRKQIVKFSLSASENKLVTIDRENLLQLWNTRNGNLLQQVNIGRIADQGPILISPNWGNEVNEKGKPFLIDSYQKSIDYLEVGDLSPDEQFFATATTQTDGAAIWNLKTGKLEVNLQIGSEGIFDVAFAPNSEQLLAAGRSGAAVLLNLKTMKILELDGHTNNINTVGFNAAGSLAITGSYDSTLKIWDAISGRLVKSLNAGDVIWHTSFSPDGSSIVATTSQKIMVWDAHTYQLRYTDGLRNKKIISSQFLKDPSKVLLSFYGNTSPLIYNIKTGKVVDSYPSSMAGVANVNSNNSIITTAFEDRINRWNATTGKLLTTFFSIDTTDYFSTISGDYYKCSPNASKLLHYVTNDLKVISFEQLDVKYNRPDKVLEAIGNTDTALINSYRKAYEKRIKKLGIDTTAFRDDYSVPKADFTNRDGVEYELKNEKLTLHIKGMDSTYKLDRLNIWVNETPVYGQRGLTLRYKNVNQFDSTFSINLSEGKNIIETSITNVNGTESYRMPLQVNYTPANKPTEKTYFIGIGIDQFNDSKYNLKYSTKDIRDLCKKLKEKYTDIIIDTLFNDNVTISNVKALKQKLLQTFVNDKVIISYSGHGMLSKDFDYYLSTYAVNFDKPEENGLPYDELENLLDSIPARKKLMLIDACHSGEVDKDDLIALNATDNKLIKGIKPVAYKKVGKLGLKNSFELMQSLFVNVGKSTGATIISAAAGTQFALEGVDNLPNGVFTYCILEAMNKYPSIKISELKKYVGERVVELTKGLQKPTSRNETIAVDWEIW